MEIAKFKREIEEILKKGNPKPIILIKVSDKEEARHYIGYYIEHGDSYYKEPQSGEPKKEAPFLELKVFSYFAHTKKFRQILFEVKNIASVKHMENEESLIVLVTKIFEKIERAKTAAMVIKKEMNTLS